MIYCVIYYNSWNQTGPWWKREFQKDYLFSLSLDHVGLRDYLKQMKLEEIVSKFTICVCVCVNLITCVSVFTIANFPMQHSLCVYCY